MNVTSANAILKALEEPSGGTVFLLVGVNIDSILLTIKSRSQLVKVLPFNSDECLTLIKQQYDYSEKQETEIKRLINLEKK